MQTMLFGFLWSLGVSQFAAAFLCPSRNTLGARTLCSSSSSSTTQLYSDPDASFDMNELKQRIADEYNPLSGLFSTYPHGSSSTQQAQLLANHTSSSASSWPPKTVYIVTFEQRSSVYGDDDDTAVVKRGMHSIEYPKDSGNNVVLAFAKRDACDAFCDALPAQQHEKQEGTCAWFEPPVVQETFLDTLYTVCEQLGVYVQFVPPGVTVVPPSQNVEQLGQPNPQLRVQQSHLNYIFSMVDGADFEDDGMMDIRKEAAFE